MVSIPGWPVRRMDDKGNHTTTEVAQMKYLLTIFNDESGTAEATPDQIKETMAAYGAFGQAIEEAGVHVAGEGLQPTATATTVRVRDGERLADRRPVRRDARSSSAGSTCSTARTSTRRSAGPPRSPARSRARSRCGR